MPKKLITIDQDKLFNKFTENAKKVIVSSYDLARRDKANAEMLITPKHLFAAILYDKKNMAARMLEKLNVDLVKTADAIMNHSTTITYQYGSLVPNDTYKKVLAEAFIEAANLGHVYVGCEHILLSILKFEDLQFINDLVKSGLSYDRIKKELLSFGTYQPGVFTKQSSKDTGVVQLEEEPTGNILDYFGRNMIDIATEGKYLPVLGREEEVERLIHILSRRTKNNPILVGEAGVGKTAIVEGLAQRIVSGDVPPDFRDVEIIQIDIAGIIAGAKVRGDVEERIISIMEEIENSPGTILFIDEIHTIVGSGGGGGSDIANILKPYLTGSEIQIIGATTRDEYRKYFEEEGALVRRFQPIYVDELDVEATIQVLNYLKNTFEKYHKVAITEESIKEAAVLSQRYVLDRSLPDKAIDLLDEAAAKKKISRNKRDKKTIGIKEDLDTLNDKKDEALRSGNLELASALRIEEIEMQSKLDDIELKSKHQNARYKVEAEDIREVVSSWTKIPVSSLSAADLKSIDSIKKILSKRIIGQENAIERVGNALKRAKLGLADAKRPMGSFLFLGPTGVGKTETAKVIAKELFGSENSLIQANMSEYMEQHSVSKIIGAPPGYIGYQDGNHLTERIRQNPYSVVLFDEIEKAHPDTLNILLQILEEGYVDDSKGRKVSFKNCIIILTSNIGASEIADDNVLGFDVNFSAKQDEQKEKAYEEMRNEVMTELKEYLRPEFINRLDEIIVFRGLNEADAHKIARIQVDDFADRLREKHIALKVSKNLIDKIAEDGFSKEYGARNIRRKVQEVLENGIAEYLLEKDLIPELQKRAKKKRPHLLLSSKLKKDGEITFTKN